MKQKFNFLTRLIYVFVICIAVALIYHKYFPYIKGTYYI